MVSDSILVSVKNSLGIGECDNGFDADIIMHINSVLATLNQIGVGPRNGLYIENDAATWDDLLDDVRLNFVKSWIYLKVRLLFDPPPTSFAISAIQEQIKEFEFRIYTFAEVEKCL